MLYQVSFLRVSDVVDETRCENVDFCIVMIGRAKCTMTANHQKESIGHECSGRCTYNRELDNEVWKCLQCHRAGRDTTVYGKLITKNDGLVQGLLRYVWSGFVIECPHHGEIYRSRKYWYGNNDPKDVTCVEIVHVWPGDNNNRVASDVTPRKFMEMIVYAGRSVTSYYLNRICIASRISVIYQHQQK